jgi:hypothetical protein
MCCALAFIPATMARNKGYSYCAFWAFGFFLFVPAIIVAAVIEDKTRPAYPPYPPYPGQPPYGAPYQPPYGTPYQQQPNAGPAANCPSCGASVASGSAFCPSCGARLQ